MAGLRNDARVAADDRACIARVAYPVRRRLECLDAAVRDGWNLYRGQNIAATVDRRQAGGRVREAPRSLGECSFRSRQLTKEPSVLSLKDERDITDVVMRYADAMDRRDWKI